MSRFKGRHDPFKPGQPECSFKCFIIVNIIINDPFCFMKI